MNAAMTRPDWRFLFAHPAHFVALGFGSGLAPIAPGTFGTLVAIPLAIGLRDRFGDVGYLVAIAAFLLVGIYAAAVTSRHLGVDDHGSIVWDEVVAFLLVLFFVGDEPVRLALAFFLFRLFDILKPPPIRQIDERIRNGFGVMADDLVAAGYTLVVMAIGVRLVQ